MLSMKSKAIKWRQFYIYHFLCASSTGDTVAKPNNYMEEP